MASGLEVQCKLLWSFFNAFEGCSTVSQRFVAVVFKNELRVGGMKAVGVIINAVSKLCLGHWLSRSFALGPSTCLQGSSSCTSACIGWKKAPVRHRFPGNRRLWELKVCWEIQLRGPSVKK